MRLKFETSEEAEEEAEEEVDATSNRRLRGSYALSTPSRTEGVRRLSQLGPQRAGLIFGSGDLDGYVALLVRSAASRLLPPLSFRAHAGTTPSQCPRSPERSTAAWP